MRIKILAIVFLISAMESYCGELVKFVLKTESSSNLALEFALRVPDNFSREKAGKSRIMVLFGGRNWPGEKTIGAYKFDKLADRHMLFLLSPSYKDDDYWEPEKWSGAALEEAVNKVKNDYGLKKDGRLFYYGYSAGGQCANLFANWKPESVEAWGSHACGVWPTTALMKGWKSSLVTCGEEDVERYQVSVAFVCNAREKGYPVIWKSFSGQGHELSKEALTIAWKYFDSYLRAKELTTKYIGDGQTMEYYPAVSKKAARIEPEDANFFWDEEFARFWKTGK